MIKSRLPLNPNGFSHILPLLIVVLVGVAGAYFIVSSHATEISVPRQRPNPGVPRRVSNPGVPTVGPNTNRVAQDNPNRGSGSSGSHGSGGSGSHGSGGSGSHGSGGSGSQGSGGGSGSTTGGDGGPAITTGAATGTVSMPGSSKASQPAKPKPSGDIIVTTYVDDPKIDKKGGKDHRIGGFKVKVENLSTSGPNNCDNTKRIKGVETPFGTTNKKVKTKVKGQKDPVLVHGTVHFLNCDAGKYKVTILTPLTRGNYELETPSVRTFTLNDNETEVPFFVVKKKTAKGASGSTTQNPANGQSTGNGGTQAP